MFYVNIKIMLALIQFMLLFAILEIVTMENVGNPPYQECVCGIGNEEEINFRMVNGAAVHPHAYPFVVYLSYHGWLYCGGSLINDKYILTAAHCIYGHKTKYINIHLGAHNTSNKINEMVIGAEYAIMHENYTRMSNYDTHDIGLIKLEDYVIFNNFISPVCLPKNNKDNYAKQAAIIMGWGTIQMKTKKTSEILQQAPIRIIEDYKCMRNKHYKNKFLVKDMMCGYGYTVDTCQGDSGGPVYLETSPYKFEQIGIVSFGYKCGAKGVPGIYNRVAEYIDWIMNKTQDANYCAYE